MRSDIEKNACICIYGYSDYFAVKFDNECQFYELESTMQSKEVNDTCFANMTIFSEMYDVYDYEKQEEAKEVEKKTFNFKDAFDKSGNFKD